MSPEAFEAPDGAARLRIGRASDVWSLGCIFYQMVYYHPPFYALPNMHAKMRAISDPSTVIEYPSTSVPMIPANKTSSGKPERDEEKAVKVPECFISTMKSCLVREAKARATIPELLDELWVRTIRTSAFLLLAVKPAYTTYVL